MRDYSLSIYANKRTETFRCQRPYTVEGVTRMCRKGECDYCRYLKRKWMMGRIAAEMFQADHVRFVTLTYDDDHIANVKWEDLKDYVKVRRRRYTMKHFSVFEYGDRTGRPHWHSVQMYFGAAPEDPLDVAADHYGWAKGTSQYELVRSTAGAVGYLFGYLDKGGKCTKLRGFGNAYLLEFARMRARQKDRLTNANSGAVEFTIPGVRKKEGGSWIYTVPGNAPICGMMANAYLEEWEDLYGELPIDPLKGIDYGS